MLHLHLMTCSQMQRMCLKYVRFAFDVVQSNFNYVNGLNNFNDVTFAFDDVL